VLPQIDLFIRFSTFAYAKNRFAGSYHWCTEAILRSLRGPGEVAQGWINSDEENAAPSEAIIVHFDPSHISLATLLIQNGRKLRKT
jgi:peptide-methionine (S)-S-oxide reductase